MRIRRIATWMVLVMLCLASTGYAELIEPIANAELQATGITAEAKEISDRVVAGAFVLMDNKTGKVLLERNADVSYSPIIAAPLVNAMVALDVGKLDDVLTVPDAINSLDRDLAVLPLVAGETISLKQALYAMLICSANDAAMTIALNYAPSLDEYVNLMNAKAKVIGCADTHFDTFMGFRGNDQNTTSMDLALIFKTAMADKTLSEMLSTNLYEKEPTRVMNRMLMTGTNLMLDHTSHAFYPNAVAGKTGFTNETSYVIVELAAKDDMELLVTMFQTNRDARWSDTQMLMEYGFGLK